MSGLLTPILSVVQEVKPKVNDLAARLTAARAAALDDLDHSVLDAAGPLGAPPTLLGDGVMSAGFATLSSSTLPRVALGDHGGVLTPVIDVTGSGVLQFAGILSGAASAFRLRITIDGLIVADSGNVSPTGASQLLTLAGIGTNGGAALDAVAFRSSLLIEAATIAAVHDLYFHYRLTGWPA